jgi:hypothetical protein
LEPAWGSIRLHGGTREKTTLFFLEEQNNHDFYFLEKVSDFNPLGFYAQNVRGSHVDTNGAASAVFGRVLTVDQGFALNLPASLGATLREDDRDVVSGV